ncbi:MAG: hypothetical protein JWR55_836 [Aeromicrobium sp.]|jgi:hypothetical protein|nr:hypothetical protein [Aeromicrobium sp.]
MRDSSPFSADWRLQVFRVRNRRRQDRIVAAFARVDRPGVLVLPVRSDSDWFIVVECHSGSAMVDAIGVIGAIDPWASRTHVSASPSLTR